jgi:hypothetical protein
MSRRTITRIRPRFPDGQHGVGKRPAHGAQFPFAPQRGAGGRAHASQFDHAILGGALHQQEWPALVVIPAHPFPHGRKHYLVAAVLGRHFEIQPHAHPFAWLYVALGPHPRAVHDDGAGFRVENVIADAEAFSRAPGHLRVVLNFELGVRGSLRRIQLDFRREVGGAHA